MKERVAIVTLGCDKNRVDSEIMAGILYYKGYKITTSEKDADYIIVNTCTFIEDAKKETENAIKKALSNKNAKVIIAGCHVQRLKEEIIEKFPDAHGYLDTNWPEKIDKAIEAVQKGRKIKSFAPPTFLYHDYEKRMISTLPGSAYIKISEGCDHRCTFCIILKVKGRNRSREIEEIVDEARHLTTKGVKEIILIAQDLNSYGMDLYGKPMLKELINRLSDVDDIRWIRLLYMYPFNFPYEILDLMKEDSKLCKYIDLPLQHISDNILRKMGRKGSREDTIRLIEKIREKVPDVTLRTSFIVGFPGEKEEDIYRLREFMEWAKFHWTGIFIYSNEEGTYSYTLPEQIPEHIKKQRWNLLMALQKDITRSLNKKRIGKKEKVIIEGKMNNIYIGRTQKEAPEIDGIIKIYGAKDKDIGEIRDIRIISSSHYDLAGVLD